MATQMRMKSWSIAIKSLQHTDIFRTVCSMTVDWPAYGITDEVYRRFVQANVIAYTRNFSHDFLKV